MVHHGSLDARRRRAPRARPAVPAGRSARWLRRAYARRRRASCRPCDPRGDTGRAATLPLRFGLDPAFFPQPTCARGDHVLYAGRIGREKGVFELLEAAARSREPWPLWLMGTGRGRAPARRARPPARPRRARAHARPRARPRARSPAPTARARCVVMPGELETFGLVAFEAARQRRSPSSPARPRRRRGVIGDLVETFPPGDPRALLAAIERARAREPDRLAAARFAAAQPLGAAFAAELADLTREIAAPTPRGRPRDQARSRSRSTTSSRRRFQRCA